MSSKKLKTRRNQKETNLKNFFTNCFLKHLSKYFSKLIIKLNHNAIFFIIITALLFRLYHLSKNYALWWDSYIYIGISKYIFSTSNLGLWEVFRPLIHPTILGSFWKLGFPLIAAGTMLDIVFSLLSVYLLYIITCKIYDRNIAKLAAFLLATSSIFTIHTGLLLTEPLAMFLSLLAVYFFTKYFSPKNVQKTTNKKYLFLSGFLIGLAALTKFPLAILLIAAILSIILSKQNFHQNNSTQKITTITGLTISFSLPILAFLILNYFLYKNPMLPFQTGSWIVSTYTWIYQSNPYYYFNSFFLRDTIYLLIFTNIIIFFKNKLYQNTTKSFITFSAFFLFAYFFFLVERKEVRYLTLIIPFFAMLVSSTIFYPFYKANKNENKNNDYKKIESKKKIIKKMFYYSIFLFIIFWVLSSSFLSYQHIVSELNFNNDILNEGISVLKEDLKKETEQQNLEKPQILATSPYWLSEIDLKFLPLTSNPTDALYEYNRLKDQTPYLLVRDCDLLCEELDQTCLDQKNFFLTTVRADLNSELLFEKRYIIQKPKITECKISIFKLNQQ